MRLIGPILSVGAITWGVDLVSGGDNAGTAVPEGHQGALRKAEELGQTLVESTQKKMQDLEEDE